MIFYIFLNESKISIESNIYHVEEKQESENKINKNYKHYQE